MTVDPAKLKAILYSATRFPWKYTYAYNNGGMPTADFYIPGHNGNATVEILADDAALIVEGLPMLQELLELYEAAIKFKQAHLSGEEIELLDEVDRQLASGKVFARRDDLLDIVNRMLPEAEDDTGAEEET